jgi:hypothetical protein
MLLFRVAAAVEALTQGMELLYLAVDTIDNLPGLFISKI